MTHFLQSKHPGHQTLPSASDNVQASQGKDLAHAATDLFAVLGINADDRLRRSALSHTPTGSQPLDPGAFLGLDDPFIAIRDAVIGRRARPRQERLAQEAWGACNDFVALEEAQSIKAEELQGYPLSRRKRS